MWESLKSTSQGGVSLRSIFAAVLAIFVVAFLWVTLTPTNSYAAEASWSNDVITYEGNNYRVGNQTLVSDLGLPSGSPVYFYTDPEGTANRKMHILYAEPSTDITSASQLSYRTYSYNGVGNFSNPSPPATVTVAETADPQDATSCAIEGGMGWFVCPVSNFFAWGTDMVFNALTEFLEVRQLEMNQNSTMYRAWSYMRTFANIAFVIGFLIIIYSQLTNVGVTNYGLKKLLPRIIIAAILVNLSFVICAIAIDISNLLGYTMQDLFNSMRDTLVGPEGANHEIYTWESVTAFVLAGGTATIAGGTAAFIAGSSNPVGVIFLILPVLLGVFIAILVALLILAARQAIITVLTMIAPLAFVAYLLPNTEKWFDKWRTLFMTMLIFFPAFSIVFGGAQLAGSIIIQNAESLNTVILGMATQVAPLVITPLLLKLSGNLLARIAGVVNNPNKGLMDRTRNWAKDRAELARDKRMATPARRRDLLKRAGQSFDHNRRRREGWKNAYKAMGDANWAQSRDYSDIDQVSRRAAEEKQLGESLSGQRYTNAKTTNVEIQRLDIDVRNAKATLENLEKAANIQYDNLKSDPTAHNIIPSRLAAAALVARTQARESSILDGQVRAAANVQQTQFAEAMAASEDMQRRAGGIDEQGGKTALANAISTMRSSYNKNVEEATAIFKHFNLSGPNTQKLALGTEAVSGVDSRGVRYTFSPNDVFAREAAIETQLNGGGTVAEMIEIIEKSGTDLYDYRTTIKDAMIKSGFGGKTIWGGGRTIDDVAQGNIRGRDDLLRAAAESIAKGKVSAADLARADSAALEVYSQIINDPAFAKSLIRGDIAEQFDENFISLSETAAKTMTGDESDNLKQNSTTEILKLARFSNPTFNPKDKATWPDFLKDDKN